MSTVDIDSILDSTLDDLADLPEFKPFPVGFHKVTMDLSLKDLGEGADKKSGVQADFTYAEPLELANPEEEPPKQGDKCSIFCDLGNEFGQGTLKMILSAIKPAFPDAANNRQVIEQAKQVSVAISTGLRPDKNDKDRKYMQLKKIDLL